MFQSPAASALPLKPGRLTLSRKHPKAFPLLPLCWPRTVQLRLKLAPCSAQEKGEVGDPSMLVLPIFLGAPSMSVVWHTGSGSRMPEWCRDSWFPCTLGMEPQVWRQAPTAQVGE